MNFKQVTEKHSIVYCSTRGTSPRDLCIMTLRAAIVHASIQRGLELDGGKGEFCGLRCRLKTDFFENPFN